MKNTLFIALLLVATISFAQVGINNSDPKASLDIVASNQALPTNTDGIIVPRVDSFPATNPGADQNSMIVYLTTTSGADTPGFYYWDNATTSWLPLGSGSTAIEDLDWFEQGATTAPNAITDNIFTNGNVAVGGSGSITSNAQLDVQASNQAAPSNTDGILISRVDAFPATNPGAAQNGLMVYLTTGFTASGDTFEPGFYFWNHSITTWIRLDESAWKEVGTDNPLNDSNQYIYTERGVSIGHDTNDGRLLVSSEFGDTRLTIDANRDGSQTSRAPRLLFQIEKEDQPAGLTGKYRFASIALDGAAGGNIVTNSNAHDLIFSSQSDDVGFQFIPGENPALTVAPSGQLTLHEYAGAASTTPFGPGTGFTGTAVSTLALDVDGNLIQQPLVPASTTAWDITGNSGTTSGTNFLGTTDGQALDIRTNNIIHQRFTTDGRLEFLNTGGSVIIGEGTGTSDDGTDNENVFIGKNVAPNVSTGSTNASDSDDNVGIAREALNSLTDGTNNIAVGRQALQTVTTNQDNVAIGTGALQDLAAAAVDNGNIAIGSGASANRISGGENTIIGYNAEVFRAATGNGNTGFGARTLQRMTDGFYNTAIGYNSGSILEDGSYNTLIGRGAASGNTSGEVEPDMMASVIIGDQAGGIAHFNNLFVLDNSIGTTPLLSGVFANDSAFGGGGIKDQGPYNDNRLAINIDYSGNAVNLTHTLTVGGNVFASGGFETTANTYPDYVFEDYFTGQSTINKDYKFMSLNEAVKFVEENGHLPNVKSFKEVEANNFEISLNETSLKNLEKIEENFLYIKEINEKNEALQKENAELKSQMDVILKRLEKLENNKN